MFGQKWLYSGKVVVFRQCGRIRAEVVVFRQSGCTLEKWLYSCRRAFIRAKVVAFGQK